jgi:ParB/RepB/Spo0J family partition protein
MKSRKLSFVPTPEHYAVPMDQIQGKPVHEDQAFDELVSSVQLMGILQPVVLKAPKTEHGKYTIMAGTRRCYACVKLGITHISAVVFPWNTDEAFVDITTITENSVRSNNIGADVLAMKRLVDNGDRDVDSLSLNTGLPKSRIKQLFELIDLPEPVVIGITEGKIAPTTAKEVKKLKPKAMDRALAVLEETGKLTGKDVHKVREVQVESASEQIVLPSIPALPSPDTLTVMVGTPDHGKTNMDMTAFIDRQSIVAILKSHRSTSEKLAAISVLVGYKSIDVKVGASANNDGTIAQRARTKKQQEVS